MSVAAFNSFGRYPDMSDMGLSGTSGVNLTYNSSSVALAQVFQIPFTGTIANVHYNIASRSSPVLTLRIELRTVSATTGQPDAAGTLYGSSTSITSANPASTGNKTAAVNCTGATKGDICALVLDLSAYTSGSIGIFQRWAGTIGGIAGGFPYTVTTGTIGTNNFNTFALEYSSTIYSPLTYNTICGSGGVSSQSVSNSGVTRRGNQFIAPFNMRVSGVYAFLAAAGDCFLRVRDSGDNILATATIDKDQQALTTMVTQVRAFDSGATIDLQAGQTYHVLVEGNSATSTSINSLTGIVGLSQQDMLSGGQACFGESYNSGYSSSNTTRYGIGVLYDQIAYANQLVNSSALVG